MTIQNFLENKCKYKNKPNPAGNSAAGPCHAQSPIFRKELQIIGRKMLTLRIYANYHSYSDAMKTLIIRLLFVLAAMLPGAAEISAQIYEADYLIGNYIRAFTTDEEGTRWRVKIPNGTKIEVSHRIAEDDSTSCRSILAEFEYEDEI